MGVKQLWKLLNPTSQSVLLSSLSGKRVAVDASIWLYQFLMAMRDHNTGKTLTGAHLIGFLNRILKFLFHGIQPIFVYDGAVPVFKKQVIQQRRAQRQSKVDKTEKIAEKILEKRIKLFALKAGDDNGGRSGGESDNMDAQPVVEAPLEGVELDEYHLPPTKRLKLGGGDVIHQADLRMPDEQELFEFVEEHRREIDLNRVDINSEQFKSLSLEKQHEIILSLKNQSRIPSLDRVQQMLQSSKTSKDFSLAQIKNLVHRATLTDRYHSTLKQGKPKERRVEGFRQRDFILSKDQDDKSKIGWDLRAQQKTENAVVDLSGTQGFSVVKPSKPRMKFDDAIADTDADLEKAIKNSLAPFSKDGYVYVEDDISDQAIWDQIQEMEKNEQNKEDEVSLISTVSISEESIQVAITEREKIENVDTDSSGLKEADQHEACNDEFAANLSSSVQGLSFDSQSHKFVHLYPDFNARIENLKTENDYDMEISKTEKRLGKEHDSEFVTIHRQYLSFIKEEKVRFVKNQQQESREMVPDYKLATSSPIGHSIKSPMSGGGRKKIPLYFDDDDDEVDIPKEGLKQDVDQPSSSVTALTHNPNPAQQSGGEQEKDIFPPLPEVIDIHSDEDEDEFEWVEPEIRGEEGKSTSRMVNQMNEDDKLESLPVEEDEEEEVGDVIDIGRLADAETSQFMEDAHYIPPLTEQERLEAIQAIDQDIFDLSELQKREMKNVGEVSSLMIEETQNLLRLFGIPFITAPMEAESQCAHLLQQKVVHGIVTDDSDVFLFGGDNVYKNLFDLKKFIEKFSMSDLVEKMSLKRHHLIQLAYLLGSDYTPGLRGIGPVSAIEIVTSWTSEDLSGLRSFKHWVLNLQLGFTDPDDSTIQKKLRNTCKKLEMPPNFPNPSVLESYMNPVVETFQAEAFQWTTPHLSMISTYLQRKLGWPIDKVEAKVIPVLQALHSRNTRQTQIDSFFELTHTTPKVHKSKRVTQALASSTDKWKGSASAADKKSAAVPRKSRRGGRKNRVSRVDEFL